MTPVRSLLGWLVLLCVGFTNGVLRQAGYARLMEERTANQVSVGLAIALLGTAVWLLARAWPLSSPGQAWRVGALWCVLTLLFETALGRAGGHSWERIFHEYALWEGRLWALVPLFILVAPRLAWAARARPSPRAGSAAGLTGT